MNRCNFDWSKKSFNKPQNLRSAVRWQMNKKKEVQRLNFLLGFFVSVKLMSKEMYTSLVYLDTKEEGSNHRF